MLRSMYSGISGMKVNQTKLDVIGNNISNVGTTSFKSSRARFSDMLSQNVSDAMAPSNNQGGVNASQVGLGVQLASIDSVMTQGMMQPTGRALDVAIDGDGFFMVSKGPAIFNGSLEVNHRAGAHNITGQSLANSGSELMYSRDGSFILDESGNLLTGDGFRVLGYSLTNDDSSQSATSKIPTPVNTAGLDFRFGPGSQLNGYKVVLGAVGPGTVTSADVDKAQKQIIVSGDFATPGALTTAQVESAINKGLSSAGISQQVFVSGKPINIENLGSESVKGGTDASAPKALAIGGFNIQLSEGALLNGYKFKIGNIAADPMSVAVEENLKEITINANFLNRNFNATDLKDEINTALQGKGITQEVSNITGSAMTLQNIQGVTDSSGVNNKRPTLTNPVTPSTITITNNPNGVAKVQGLGGLDFDIDCTNSELNGYTLMLGKTDKGTPTSVTVENGSIVINGSFNDPDVATAVVLTDLQTKINSALSSAGLKSTISVTGTAANNNLNQKVKFDGGITATSPKDLNIAGLKVTLPEGDFYNGLEFEITDIKSGTLDVKLLDPNKKKITISGDFTKKVYPKDLETLINAAVANLTPAPPVGMKAIKVEGSSKVYTGLTSDAVEGGQVDKAPEKVKVAGMELELGAGGDLNGYKFVVGKITAGTKTEASIDEKNKTVTINADLVTPGATTALNIQDALYKAMQDKGIDQGITVAGKPAEIGGVESTVTSGGTPVQSMGEDGAINFVDGTKDLKSYDGQLKTLKIPDKVKIPGTDLELRVKTYTIDKNGIINGVLEDGRVAALGQIAMSSFKNPEGLTKLGGNLYGASVNSGDAVIKSGVGTLADDNSKGYGDNLQGMLEMSNVDLAEQFTDMIVSSRAFQASGKMITTGDEILQDIINLKR